MSYVDCAKDLTKFKKTDDYSWLSEVDSTALQSSLKNPRCLRRGSSTTIC